MKKFISLIIPAILSIYGCSDFLTEKNPATITSITDSEIILESAVEGIMWSFTGTHGINGDPNQYFGMASGLIHWGNPAASYLTNTQYTSCLQFTQYSTGKVNGYAYQIMSRPIVRANQVIDQLSTSPVDAAYKIEIEAEAKFYRAIALFLIVRFYGDAPVKITPDDAVSATNSPRIPYYNVYVQIIKDLEFAEKNMRSPERAKEIKPDLPRVNKYAATAFLSSVYTQIGSLLASPDDNFWNPAKEGRTPDFSKVGVKNAADAYAKALEYAEKLIPESASHDSGCGYRLLTKFGDNFTWDSSFSRDGYNSYINPEQVFTIPVASGSGVSQYYDNFTMPQYPGGTNYTTTNSNYGIVRPDRWLFQKWCETYPGIKNAGNTLYLSSSDPRLNDTFYHTSMVYSNGSGTLSIYPAFEALNNRDSSYPYFKKEAGPDYSDEGFNTDQCVMRFAEVYLNAVEAAAYLDKEPLARKYMDVLHARARHSVADGEGDSTQPSWEGVTFSTKDELMTRIFWERMFEQTGEHYQEYFNTHRHGAKWLVDNISKPKNLFLSRSTESGSKHYPTDFKYSEDPDEVRKGLLIAFPSEEIIYNASISEDDHNDYWYGL